MRGLEFTALQTDNADHNNFRWRRAMQNRGLKTLIISTALVPSLLIAIALGIYLSHSRLQDLDRLLEQRGRATALQLANTARQALQNNDDGALYQLAALALEEPGVDAVTIFDADRNPRAHAGPPIDMTAIDFAQTGHSIERTDSLRFVQPLLAPSNFTATFYNASSNAAAPSNRAANGWVVVDYSRQPYLIETYRSLFISGIIVALALLGATISAVFASRRLTGAVDQLRDGIQRIAEGSFDTPIHIDANSALHVLAADINRMASTIDNASIELRRHLEQTNRDLRESLETVEVQNIELDLARREALEASRIKSEFLANTSHELRTPLNGIIGFTKLLLKSLLDARQREYLETIRHSAESLLGIINDILDFSKIEAGKLVLDNNAFNLREAIEETLAMLAPSANEKKIDLILLYDNDVPNELIGDALRLRQVLTNLISNAIKFTTQGHIAIRVEATAAIGARAPLKISVSDTGIGISIDQQRQLFQAFAQADATTSREFGGTGLGLAISKKLIEQMGGEIGLDSELGHGSTFWFSLRLPVMQKPLSLRQFNLLEGKRVVLCDTHPLSKIALQQLLIQWRIDVITLDHWDELIGYCDHYRDPSSGKYRNSSREKCDGWLLSVSANGPALENIPETSLPILILHGGSIDAQSTKNACLLAKPVSHLQLYDALCECLCPIAPVSNFSATLPAMFSSLRVLAVDDNATNLKLVDVLLTELGASVMLADNGHDALALCSQHRFDLILLDIQMPEINGAEVALAIRNGDTGNRATRIVALTAHVLPEEQRQLLANGFDACITKPITEDQLAHMLHNCMPNSVAKVPVVIEECLQRARNKPVLAYEFLRDLLHSLPTARNALATQFSNNDFAALLDETHRLHGACSYSGVPRLQQCSVRLEELIKQHAGAREIHSGVTALQAAIDELLAWEKTHDIEVLFDLKPQIAN